MVPKMRHACIELMAAADIKVGAVCHILIIIGEEGAFSYQPVNNLVKLFTEYKGGHHGFSIRVHGIV